MLDLQQQPQQQQQQQQQQQHKTHTAASKTLAQWEKSKDEDLDVLCLEGAADIHKNLGAKDQDRFKDMLQQILSKRYLQMQFDREEVFRNNWLKMNITSFSLLPEVAKVFIVRMFPHDNPEAVAASAHLDSLS